MRALGTRGHFRSRDKDGGHTIPSAIAKNPMLHTNLIALFYRVTADRSFILREYAFSTFLLLWPWPWPWYTNLTHIPWRYTRCANMNFLHQDFRKLSSDRQTYISYTYLQIDTPKLYTTPLRKSSKMALSSTCKWIPNFTNEHVHVTCWKIKWLNWPTSL